MRWCQGTDVRAADVSDAKLAKNIAAPDAGHPRRCCRSRRAGGAESVGGTAPERVAEQIAALRAVVDEHAAWAAS